MTDTGAYSDIVFGLFRLLGYRFSLGEHGFGELIPLRNPKGGCLSAFTVSLLPIGQDQEGFMVNEERIRNSKNPSTFFKR